ncbi:hypothetical protein ACH5RR_000432 [Cinchona calisaya]|uniref:Late blight resistance protein homolog R1A-3 n=1 Tax=Cinchona calisaya TaxID=153742 RepID=A0ABD3B154_9GENT
MDLSTCVDSALYDLEKLDDGYYMKSWLLRQGLRNLRTFHLCARICGHDDASLGGLLSRIESAFSDMRKADRRTGRIFVQDEEVSAELDDYHDEIKYFKREIHEWYINFLDCSRQSCSPNRDELLVVIDSLLENVEDSIKESVFPLVEQLEALLEKLIFLQNFIRFTALRGIDDTHLGHLLTHIKAVVVHAAHHSYMCQFEEDERMVVKISGLLQRIKPVDPQVYETYVQALTASKSSRQSHTAAPEMDGHVLEDFLHSLLSNLWEILWSGTFPIFSTKDHLQILYEGLRALNNILKKHAKNFDQKLWDLTAVMVCDAGLVICSLFLDATEDDLAKEMDHMLFDLLERIKLIRAKFSEESSEGSKFNFPKVDELGFIDFLLENLTEFTSWEAGPIALAKRQIQTIQEELVFLRSFLGKIVELRNEQEEFQCLWNRVVELAFRVEFLIDSLVVGDIPDSFPTPFDSIAEEVKITKLDALNIFDSKGLDIKVKKVAESSNYFPSERSMPIIKDDIVGFDDEAKSIIDRLERGAKQLQIVAIVGMPGAGKTTLAKMVYNDFSIVSHFHVCAWCCVSQVYNKKNLLLEILTYIFGKLSNEYFEMSEDDLAFKLFRSLKQRKYLIVLDDVWDISAWNSLEASFPKDACGSRIMLTSRHLDVAPKDKLDREPHVLRQLTNDEGWKLLKAKLFPRDDWPPTLCELGMQIVETCKGLPLTIVILAGTLATVDQRGWKEVVEHISSSTVPGMEQWKNMFELSYRYLPDELKPCLLYFGAFPEDQELATKKLTWLWIAEGFVRKSQSKSLEDKAKDYLMHLISRSLVLVAKQSSTGKVKTCRVHDLLHQFCIIKAKEERFFQLLQGYDELSSFNEPHNLRRLYIYSKLEHFKDSRLFCPRVRCLLFSHKGYRAISFNLSFIIGVFKLLRVLDLSKIPEGFTFPREVEILVHLRYLAVRGMINSIPSSVANLSNLETFIVFSSAKFQIDNIWNLKKLRHLQINGTHFQAGFSVPCDYLDSSAELCNLDTCSTIHLSWENLEKILRKFPNIHKLKVKLIKHGASTGESNKVLVLDYLSKLESLNVSHYSGWMFSRQWQIEFCFPSNLRKLTLSDFRLSWSKMSAIGNLPNLEVLKLLENAFIGKIWSMEDERQFPKLSFLKLEGLDIVRWTASESEDHLPCLVKLVLRNCFELKEVPSCLGNFSTLQMIEVFRCSNATSSVNQIQEEQVSMGNEDLKVLISSSISKSS